MTIINEKQFRHDRLVESTSPINKSICPLFSDNQNGDFDLLGSGVLIKLNAKYFLITAAHNIDHDYSSINTIYTYLESGFSPLYGETLICPFNEKREYYRNLDYCIIDLPPEIHTKITNFTFLTHTDILIDYKSENEIYFAAIGYPGKQTKYHHHYNHIHSKLIVFECTHCTSNEYKLNNVDSSTHFLYRYYKEVLSHDLNVGKSPYPFGLSGGGLFILLHHLDGLNIKPISKLAGISINHIRNSVMKYHYNIALKFGVIWNVIRKRYPDLSSLFPKSIENNLETEFIKFN